MMGLIKKISKNVKRRRRVITKNLENKKPESKQMIRSGEKSKAILT